MNESPAGDYIQNTVETYSDMLIRIAYHNTGNMSDAEDMAQEAFIRLMAQPPFEEEEHRKAWLIRVTVNLCRDLKKSFWHRKTAPLTEDLQVLGEPHAGVLEDIFRLPGKYRNVIYLYYYEGYNVPEIAKLLGEKENTVSSWLTRARGRLKTLMLEGG